MMSYNPAEKRDQETEIEVSLDSDICTGCELCIETCPAVFEMDEDEGVAYVKLEEVPEDAEDCVRQAEQDCPVEAIIVEEYQL